MMQMNIERMINATGSLLIWLVMILAAVILAGLIIIAAKAISQGIKDMDRKGDAGKGDKGEIFQLSICLILLQWCHDIISRRL